MQLNGQNIDQFLSIVTCKPQNGTVFVLYNTMFLNTFIVVHGSHTVPNKINGINTTVARFHTDGGGRPGIPRPSACPPPPPEF